MNETYLLELVMVSKAVDGASFGTWNFTMPTFLKQHMTVTSWDMQCP